MGAKETNKKESNDLRKFLTAAYLMENAWAYWVVSSTTLGNKWGKPVQTYDLVVEQEYFISLYPELPRLPEFRDVPRKRYRKVMGISEATFKKFREGGLLESTAGLSTVPGNEKTIYKYKLGEKIFTPFYLIHVGGI